MIGGKAEIGPLLLKDVEQPMREFDIAVARALGVAQGLDERVVAGPVQFPGDGFKADIGHRTPPNLCSHILSGNPHKAARQISADNMPSGSQIGKLALVIYCLAAWRSGSTAFADASRLACMRSVR